jgi:hypothetical protein
MYREADRIDQLFLDEQFPRLYLDRQRRCLALYSSLKDPTIEADVKNQRIQDATLPVEAESVLAHLPSITIQ